MLKLLGWIIKAALFTSVVLVLGNWIKVGNRTVSDQVKTEIAHAENSEVADKVRGWARRVANDARLGHRKKFSLSPSNRAQEDGIGEAIPSSERQKLRALMRELNSESSAD